MRQTKISLIIVFLYFTGLIACAGHHGFPMTAHDVCAQEARDEQADEVVGVLGGLGINDGMWGVAGRFGGQLRRWRAGPERLLWRLSSSS